MSNELYRAAVEKYREATAESRRTYTAAVDAAEVKRVKAVEEKRETLGYEAARHAASIEMSREVAEAREIRNRGYSDAWLALAKIDGGDPAADKIAAFIVANCRDNKSEGLRVIGSLPATLDELDELATELDWCAVWDWYRIQALRAGVFSESPMTPHRADLHETMRERLGPLRGRQRTKFDALVDKLIAESAKAVTA